MNWRAHFWYGVQLAEFVYPIGCQDGLVIQFFLADADPAHLVTNCPDILFCVLHMNRVLFVGWHDKEMVKKEKKNCTFLILMRINPDYWMSARTKRNTNPVL